MQYGVDVDTYKRLKSKGSKTEISTDSEFLKLILRVVFVFLISRVMITLDIATIDNIAPFGIAITISAFMLYDRKQALIMSLGSAVGYLSIINLGTEMSMYVGIVLSLALYNSVIGYRINDKINVVINMGVVLGVMILIRMMVSNYDFETTFVFSLVQTIIVYPVYYIIQFSIKCFQEVKSNHYYSNEEIVGMALLICLAIAGIGAEKVFGIGIRNIVSLAVVILLSYSLGAPIGGVIGIVLGTITGLSSPDMMQIVSVYAIIAFTVGIFKDTGKIFACVSAIIIYIILSLYCKTLNLYTSLEGLFACVIFVMIPMKVIMFITDEFDNSVKEDKLNEFHFDKVKEEFSNKLDDFTDVLSSMAVIIKNLSENNTLVLKDKSQGLIDSIGDRVCSKCDMRDMCWKRELHSTYSEFAELVENLQNGRRVLPPKLDNKCIKGYKLIKSAEDVVDGYILNEICRRKLEDGRNMVAAEINNMATTVGELIDDLNKNICICSDTERTVNKALSRAGIRCDNVLCYNDKNGRLNIRITLDECGGAQYCVKEILPVINKAIGYEMIVCGDGCTIDPVTKKCNFLIGEAPHYYLTSYCATACKDGEDCTGDSFNFGKTTDGRYIIVISDGMGSGAEAGKESSGIVELIDKFTKSGFSDVTAINAANSIMSMKFSEDEKFATLDMQDIDLYTGKIYFAKIGAVETFVKKSNKIQVISSKTLPFGILDTPDIEIVEKTVSNGDIIVTVSDGILDVGEDKKNYKWLNAFLMQNNTKDPKQLSDEILEEAKRLNKGRVRDDMTVIVSKVYAI